MSNQEIPDRLELKYLIPEWAVPAVRDAIQPFCALDFHSAQSPSRMYVIESLYLDTPSRSLYRVSRNRRPDRFKVRIRRYGDDQSPVFLEVKNKTHGVIRKARTRLTQAEWRERLAARIPADASPAEREFRYRLERHDLRPALIVRYEREAWVSTINGYGRVTFDRQVCVQACPTLGFSVDPRAWLPIDTRQALQTVVPRAVVLELKCTLDVPRWMSNLTERFGLNRRGVSKYCNGVERLLVGRALPTSLSQLCSRF